MTVNTDTMNTNTDIHYRPILGSSLALLSAITFANVYLFSKAALNNTDFLKFGFYWFAVSLFFNAVLFFSLKIYKQILTLKKSKIFVLIIIGILELLSTVMFFYAIKVTENPTIISFLTNSIPVFVGLLSYIFLKERFSALEYLGIIIVLTGIFLVAYKDEIKSFKDFFDLGTVLALISSFLIAASTVTIKHNAKNLHPLSIGLIRVIFLFGFFLISILISGHNISINQKALSNIVAGSLLGPVAGVLLSVYALKFVEATIMSILVSTKSIITMIIIFWAFGLLPNYIQISGGILSFFGIILLSIGQKIKIQKLKQ